jgi:hypothetical protein
MSYGATFGANAKLYGVAEVGEAGPRRGRARERRGPGEAAATGGPFPRQHRVLLPFSLEDVPGRAVMHLQ